MEFNLPPRRTAVGFFRVKKENKMWIEARAREESARHGFFVSSAFILDGYMDELRVKYPAAGGKNGRRKRRTKKVKEQSQG